MNTKSPEELNARVALLESTLEVEKATVANYFKTIMALEADRRKLEAEVRRLTDEAGRKPDQIIAMGERSVGKSEAVRQALDAARARGETVYEAKRAGDRRELEMTTHEREELIRYKRLMAEVRSIMRPQHMEMVDGKSKYTDFSDEEMVESLKTEVKRMATIDVNQRIDHSNSKYWQEKYHELKRLKAMEDKVAADQVAALQKRLEDTRVEINQMRCERIGNPVRCEEETRWALHCSEKTNAELRGKIEAVEQINKQLMSENTDIKRRYEGAVNEGLCLKAWKESMNQVMNRLDLQGVGRELGVPLGEDIALKALPAIRDLKAQLEGARARASQEVEESLLGSGPDALKDYSTTEEFRRSILNLGAEILEINRGNGWDTTRLPDWPYQDEGTESKTAKVRKLMTNLALIHSEVSEASEAVRKLDRQNFEEELADVIIRTLDTSHGLGIDLGPVICAKLKKNRGRGHKHGGKAI